MAPPRSSPVNARPHPLNEDTGVDFYTLLGVSRTATITQIRSAYRRLAVAVHPDRAARDDVAAATAAFQRLQRIYDTLRDADARALYDATGRVAADGEDLDGLFGGGDGAPADLYAFFRSRAAEVTAESIAAYEVSYVGSEEEAADVAAHFTRRRGAVADIIEYIPFGEESDLGRYVASIDEALADGSLVDTDGAYAAVRETLLARGAAAPRRWRRRLVAWRSGDGAAGGGGGGGSGGGDEVAETSLVAALRARAAVRSGGFDEMVASLEAKYGRGKGAKEGGKSSKARKGRPQRNGSGTAGGAGEEEPVGPPLTEGGTEGVHPRRGRGGRGRTTVAAADAPATGRGDAAEPSASPPRRAPASTTTAAAAGSRRGRATTARGGEGVAAGGVAKGRRRSARG